MSHFQERTIETHALETSQQARQRARNPDISRHLHRLRPRYKRCRILDGHDVKKEARERMILARLTVDRKIGLRRPHITADFSSRRRAQTGGKR